MKSVDIKIDDLKFADYNPRKISPKEMTKLKHSLQEFGFVQPVIVNKINNVIVGGHQRVKVAREIGMTTVPCIYVELEQEKEKQLNIALNKISGSWDEVALKDLLEELQQSGQMAVTGFDAKELERLQFKQGNVINRKLIEDYIIPPFSIWDTKQGYWQDRKREWVKQIGDSGEGRGEALIGEGLKNLANLSASGNLTGTSIFDPVLTEVVYTWFCDAGGLIVDPFAGGNTRGLVASILGYRYIGIDLNEEQVNANKVRASDINEKGARWIHDNGLNISKHAKEGTADLVFTCPPYYDLEQYTKNPDDISNAATYDAFKEVYAKILDEAAKTLKDGGFAVIVVGNIRDKEGNYHNLVGDTVKAMENAGLHFYNEIILATAIATASVRARRMFDASKKVVKTHQNILFFKKGSEVSINGTLKRHIEAGITATGHHDILVFKK